MAKVVVLNAEKMNYDGKLDFSALGDQVIVYDSTPDEEILSRVAGADVVVTKELVLSPETVASFPPSVKLIAEAGTGYNNIPLEAAKKKGIAVCNVPAYSSQRVAHTAIMMILNLSSMVQRQIRMLQAGDRTNFTRHLQVPHTEVNGKTLGIIGYGNIGKAVAKIALALDMKVLVFTRTPGQSQEDLIFTDLETVLRESDYLSLHCPLTDKTRHILNGDTLSLMKPSAFVINTSRGALIDESALIAALQEGRLAGAGLDVQETEPPAQSNPLYDLDNVILTPHMGWKGLETRQRLVSVLEGNIRGFLAGSPVNLV